MADALVSAVLQQLAVIVDRQVEQEVTLVAGVKKDVQKLTSSLQTIRAVLKDAENRQVNEEAIRIWLNKLRDFSYDMDDVLDEWSYAILTSVSPNKVCFFFVPSSCFCFGQVVLRRDIAIKIRDINERMLDIVREKDLYGFNVIARVEEPPRLKTTSFADVSEIRGRDEEKNILISKLVCEFSEERRGLHVISIVGMGGIGKTALAQLVYNDNEVVSKFEKRMWVSVSDPFDEIRIAKAIIEALGGAASNFVEFESLLQEIRESIARKRFLLVLDDVWTEDRIRWEPLLHCLKNGLHGSKILVTTRKEKVARMIESIDILTIRELPDEECWSLFQRFAFFDRSDFDCKRLDEVGKKIVGKCKGLPLAVKTVGSLLRFRRTIEEWQSILDSEMWKLEEFEKDLFPLLLLSYNELPSMVKQCFLYCAVFPKDYDLNKDHLIKLWMAQGYLSLEQNEEMEMIGQEYFDNLAARSFFQDFEKDDDGNIVRCKMHDIVHDFAQFLTKNECLMIEVTGVEEPHISPSYMRAHHSMLMLRKAASIPASICAIKKLRSLLIGNAYYASTSEILPKLFNQLTCLRALDMGGDRLGTNLIKEIPREVGKLIHLRYLNLSKNEEIEELPEILCELCNLETLELSWCTSLKRLPQGMGKLIKLRHLKNGGTSLSYMPKGLQSLTCLRTLSEFVVSGGDHGTLECLKNLNQLQGSLLIRGLGNILDVSEAKGMKLKNKKSLLHLCLRLHKEEEGGRMHEDDEVLLEALEPPLTLDKLEIVYYRGKILFPNWMLLLTKLRVLTLSTCLNCECLPPLGKLSSLESLYIWKMRNLKTVSNEFLGTESGGTSTSTSTVYFPKLKYLEFWDMEIWEEWDYGNTRAEKHVSVMPCLRSLKIGYCPKLKAMPEHLLQMTTLEKLKIVTCPTLEKLEKLATILVHH